MSLSAYELNQEWASRTVKSNSMDLEQVETAIFCCRIKQGSLPSLWIGENHGTVLELKKEVQWNPFTRRLQDRTKNAISRGFQFKGVIYKALGIRRFGTTGHVRYGGDSSKEGIRLRGEFPFYCAPLFVSEHALIFEGM